TFMSPTTTPTHDSSHSHPWYTRPFRIFQTNIREVDAGMDVDAVAEDVRDFGASAWLLNTAGLVAFYPSALPFARPSAWLRERPSGDLIGDALEAARRRGLRLLARCDFSKLHRSVYEQHPDWFYVSPAGRAQVYNDFYSCCPNSPYYQHHAFDVLSEILDRYAVSGFYFNMFNFQLRDYAGVHHGMCQCVHCSRRFAEETGMMLPQTEDWTDAAYLCWREWSRAVLRDLAGRMRDHITSKNPDAALILRQNAHILTHEVNNAVDRALPLWRYWAGEFGREVKAAHPETPAVINSVMFLDMPYRFSAEQPGLLGLHLSQTMSHGVNPWAYVLGTTRNQPDRKNFPVVKQLLRFHRDHESVYEGLRSAAKVAIISSVRSEERAGSSGNGKDVAVMLGGGEGLASVLNARRGAYRALVEGHIPFDILPDSHLVAAARDGRLTRYAALVLPNVAVLDDEQVAVLDTYVSAGGGLVATYETGRYTPDGRVRNEVPLASLGAARVLSKRAGPSTVGVGDARGLDRPMRSAYLRVTRREDLPGFDSTDLVMLDRAFLTVQPRVGAESSLTLIPQSRNGPPEVCDFEYETDHPGLLYYTYGRGRTAYFPWPVDQLFFDHSLPEHHALLAQAVATVSGGRQIITGAPPQVELVLSRRPNGEHVLHLINHSGHQDHSFHDPLRIQDIVLSLALDGVRPTQARGLVADQALPLTTDGERTCVTVPCLDLFEVVVLS
ncbi:MAG: beta-galactosidase trimerization domain-containing protein, partial [Chloroflexi bacterium]|nr:beta-galactosidase trimerization domain-containing protein [Chloroflexota bacterium]